MSTSTGALSSKLALSGAVLANASAGAASAAAAEVALADVRVSPAAVRAPPPQTLPSGVAWRPPPGAQQLIILWSDLAPELRPFDPPAPGGADLNASGEEGMVGPLIGPLVPPPPCPPRPAPRPTSWRPRETLRGCPRTLLLKRCC